MLLAGHDIDFASKAKPNYSITNVQYSFKRVVENRSDLRADFVTAWKNIDISKIYKINYYPVYQYRVDHKLSGSRTIDYYTHKGTRYRTDGPIAGVTVSEAEYFGKTKTYFTNYRSPHWGSQTKSTVKFNYNSCETISTNANLPVMGELYTKEENRRFALKEGYLRSSDQYSNEKLKSTTYKTMVTFVPVLVCSFKCAGIQCRYEFDLCYGTESSSGLSSAKKPEQIRAEKEQTQAVGEAMKILRKYEYFVDLGRFISTCLSILVFLIYLFSGRFSLGGWPGYIFLPLGIYCTWKSYDVGCESDYNFGDLRIDRNLQITRKAIKNTWKTILLGIAGLVFIWIAAAAFCA